MKLIPFDDNDIAMFEGLADAGLRAMGGKAAEAYVHLMRKIRSTPDLKPQGEQAAPTDEAPRSIPLSQ